MQLGAPPIWPAYTTVEWRTTSTLLPSASCFCSQTTPNLEPRLTSLTVPAEISIVSDVVMSLSPTPPTSGVTPSAVNKMSLLSGSKPRCIQRDIPIDYKAPLDVSRKRQSEDDVNVDGASNYVKVSCEITFWLTLRCHGLGHKADKINGPHG